MRALIRLLLATLVIVLVTDGVDRARLRRSMSALQPPVLPNLRATLLRAPIHPPLPLAAATSPAPT